MLVEELRKASSEYCNFTTENMYRIVVLALTAKALKGDKSHRDTIDMAGCVDWKNIFNRLQDEGIHIDVDVYHGDEHHRTVTFSWNEPIV